MLAWLDKEIGWLLENIKNFTVGFLQQERMVPKKLSMKKILEENLLRPLSTNHQFHNNNGI